MQNIEVVKAFYESFGRGDMATAFAIFDENLENHQQPSLPWGRVYRGHDGIQEFLGELMRWFGDIRINTHFYSDAPNDQVVVHGELHVLDRTFPYLELWQVVGGKIRRIESFLDTASMLNRLRELGRL